MDARIPDAYKAIYEKHWGTIAESETQGRLKDVYHFPLFTTSDQEIFQKVETVIKKYTQNIKVNIAFGFVLSERDGLQQRFFSSV